jgi:transcriptional regulator with XRE-family HTH domain
VVAKVVGVGRSRKHPDKKTYSGRLAIRIDELRLKAGYTVEEFQVKLGEKNYPVSVPNLYKWLNGDLQPQIDALPAIAKALGLTIAELLPKS